MPIKKILFILIVPLLIVLLSSPVILGANFIINEPKNEMPLREPALDEMAEEIMLPLDFSHRVYGGDLIWLADSQTVNYQQNRLNKLNYQELTDGVELIIESDLGSEYEFEFNKAENELIIELSKLRYNYLRPELLAESSFIKSARAIQLFNPTQTRIILEIEQIEQIEVREKENQLIFALLADRSKLNPVRDSLDNKRPLIVIDAGHGGSDPGAIGFSGTKEKVVNYQIVDKLANKLERAGFNIYLTRPEDDFVSLSRRAELANNLLADLFISIHTNYHHRQEVSGVETYAHWTASQENWALAWYVQDGIIKRTDATDHGLKAANFAVLRKSEMPAILVEAGFLSNPKEELKLKTKDYQDKVAEGIAAGIITFFANKRSI